MATYVFPLLHLCKILLSHEQNSAAFLLKFLGRGKKKVYKHEKTKVSGSKGGMFSEKKGDAFIRGAEL